MLAITEELESEPALGNRNTANRGSKDNPKLHKVPFPGFKKSKDKDTKTGSTKNGSVPEPTAKEASKSLINKLTSRGSSQVSVDIGDGVDRPMRQKNGSNDVLNGGTVEIVPLQTLANGGVNAADDKMMQNESHNTSLDTSDSIDTTSPDDSISQRNSLTVEFKQLHMQVSQV